MTSIVLLITISLTCQAFAQGAASGISQRTFVQGGSPAAPEMIDPCVPDGRLSYWQLAGLGKSATGPVDVQVYNPFCVFGPYGIHGQYSIYGPYGMFGPAGPGYGSGLGFGGTGQNDPWSLSRQYNVDKTQASAGPEKASIPEKDG